VTECGNVTSIGIFLEGDYKETNLKTDSNEFDITNSLMNNILNYVKANNMVNYRTYTIEINDNYSVNSTDLYNNDCFRLLSIK